LSVDDSPSLVSSVLAFVLWFDENPFRFENLEMNFRPRAPNDLVVNIPDSIKIYFSPDRRPEVDRLKGRIHLSKG